jgi:hypothetical protein
MGKGDEILVGLGLVFLLTACGDSNVQTSPSPNQPPANREPTITSGASSTVGENTTATGYVAAATDPDGDTLTFSISGGADAALFSMNATTGVLSFNAAPDFENPSDADGDNVYVVLIATSDGALTDTEIVNITVTDVAGGPFRVRLIQSGFTQPLFLTGAGDGSGRVLVVEKGGVVELLDPQTGNIANTPFLSIPFEISTLGERGLLGLALAPDFATSGVYYVNLSNLSGDTELRRYRVFPNDPERTDPSSAEILLTIAQPFSNHNGGWIGFGPDGFLFIASGDGGGSGDPTNSGQNNNTLLGKILRIDVSSDDFPNDPDRNYAIPGGNPFAQGGGAPEIWATGLRNPFRSSFDRATGDLYIGDVGQGLIEEIDLSPLGVAGLNFGWAEREGTQQFNGPDSPAFTPPIAEYGHGLAPRQGNSVIGGYVYRGPVEALDGEYIFGDFSTANIWSLGFADIVQGMTIASDQFTIRTDDFQPNLGTLDNISSFGEDDTGNLYIIDFDGEVFRLENAPI